MTSVDSGVETGNDSNDSSVTHENNIIAAGGTATATAAASGSSITNNMSVDYSGPHKPLALPLASIAPGPRVYNLYQDSLPSFDKFPFQQSPVKKLQIPTTGVTVTNNTEAQSTSMPSTSGPLVLHTNAESTKVLEFRIPPMYIEPLHGSNSQLLNRPVEVYRRVPERRKMMRMQTVRKYSTAWHDFKGVYDERKMRLAAATNNIEMMRRLLISGVQPNNRDDQGRSPLHLASSRGYTEVVRLLLEYGADPNQRDCLGNTPLHLAAVTSKIAVVTLLLKAGTDVLSSDLHGHNPLQLAQTKLRILQNCKGSDMSRFKEEVHNVVSMLLAYLQRQKDAREQVEALSTFCSRLSLSSTSDQIQGDVRDLLANIDSLSLAS